MEKENKLKRVRRSMVMLLVVFIFAFYPYLKPETVWAEEDVQQEEAQDEAKDEAQEDAKEESKEELEEEFQLEGTTITVTPESGSDIYTVMKSATTYVRDYGISDEIYTIRLAEGEYQLSNAIRVFGNVTLDLTGVTLRYVGKTNNMLMLGNASTNLDPEVASGYGTRHNITILGGTWIGNDANTSSLVKMSHSSNVLFDGCVFSGGGCAHQMEVAAIDGFTVKDCTFQDAAKTDKKKEALQLDVVCSTSAFKNSYLDGTPMKNVTITGCTFKNVIRGVGTHSMLMGSYHTNITITNNLFENIDGECIVALNYQNCTIRDNVMKNAGAGIIFQFFKPGVSAVYNTIQDGTVKGEGKIEHDADSIITNNQITLSTSKDTSEYVGIRVYGYHLQKDTKASGTSTADLISKGNYYVSNVTVTNNTIKTCGCGIRLSDARECTVSGNTITNTNKSSEQDGILVDAESKNIIIQNNSIKNATRHGIRLTNYSSAQNIYGNTIQASAEYGISLYNNSRVTGNIEKNIVRSCKKNGICLEHLSQAKNISDNTVTSAGKHGINLYNGSTVTGSITGNKVSKSTQNGIFINLDSTVKSITKNTLSENGKYGIALYDGSKVVKSISSNSISKNKRHAIQLSLDCAADKINSNKITNTKGKGVLILKGSTVSTSISNNRINTATQEGIYIESNKNKFEIRKNVIKKCSRSSILINTTSKKKITIVKNTITVKKGMKRLVVLGGKVKSDIKETEAKKKK